MRRGIILFACVVLMAGCASGKTSQKGRFLSEKDAKAVAEGLIRHGLDKEEVTTRLGMPEKTFGYQKNGKMVEFWIYSELEWHEYQNVLFEDGVVVAWNVPDSIKRRLDEVAVNELLEKAGVPEEGATAGQKTA